MTKQQVDGQVSWFDADTASGKMSQVPSPATTEKTFKPSSRSLSGSQSRTLPMCLCLTTEDGPTPGSFTKNWGGGQWPGGLTMRSTGASRKEGKESVYWLTSTGLQQARFCLILNCGEQPRMENRSHLIDILEPTADPKYRLSPKACQGILRRAERRGKELPPLLKVALILQAQEEPSAMESQPLTATP